MNQDTLPLYNALLNHKQLNPFSFHVPGHKNSTVFPVLKNNVYEKLLEVDVTELRGLDDLHSAKGVIKEAQDLTADLYKVLKSYFLVGGSTAGNLAMILSTCEANNIVLVQRNSHKSIMNGLRLANVNPIFLNPEYDHIGQFSTNVSRETVEKAIKMYPDAKILILTSPNYYGMVSKELHQIIKMAHSYGLLVLIDEAHGAHLILGEPFPSSAINLGADIVVQSAHKTLPAMTMGSYLHVNSPQVDLEKLEFNLQVIQSSSPSYPILASLDIARYYLAHITDQDKNKIASQINDFRNLLQTIPQLTILENENEQNKRDLLKLIVQTKCNLSGYDIQKVFEKEMVYTELADPWNVLFVLPLAPDQDYHIIFEKIKRSLHDVPLFAKGKISDTSITDELKISPLAIPYEEMKKYKKAKIPLNQTIGNIAATSIIPYPPGIPLILHGERITEHHLKQLFSLKTAGAYFQNNNDIWENGLEVFKKTLDF